MNPPIYAHSLPGQPPNKWQLLEDHSRVVAEMAREFGLSFVKNIRVESVQWEVYAVYCC